MKALVIRALRLRNVFVLGGLVVVLFIVRPWRRDSSEPSSDSSAQVTTVITVRPHRETLHRTIAQPGQIEAFERTPLFAKIAGFVQGYYIDIGDNVRKGQLLAQLWVPELVATLRQKEAGVAQAEAELLDARAALKAADANVNQASANLVLAQAVHDKALADVVRWKAAYKRDGTLVGTMAVSQETFEITTDQYRSAEAARSQSAAGIDSESVPKGGIFV
jgi:HlyD family secretion protein